MSRNVKEKRLSATTSLADAVSKCDFAFLCVGTPSTKAGSTDLSHIKKAAADLGKAVAGKTGRHVLVVKSTVPPGTTESLGPLLQDAGVSDFGLCMAPEFLREGNAVNDFFKPDRIVVGGKEAEDADEAAKLFSKINASLLKTDLRTAETIKYASNAFLATKISFANELAGMCERFGVDVYDVGEGMGHDKRIGCAFLKAGAGFGSSCFKKDVSSLIHEARKRKAETAILDAVMNVNERQPLRVVELLQEGLGSLKGKRIALLGLAFKDDTDDVRDSAAIKVARMLVKEGARVVAHDPKAIENAKRELGDSISYAASAAAALEGADACALVTEWKLFAGIQLSDFKKMKGKLIVEGRDILDKKALKKAGFKYLGIGRRP